ncbi:MAG: metallophosphoesterase [Pirellulaceae bacterium]|nr:metallophosphoesterase [Pirellulaceae bacterium]
MYIGLATRIIVNTETQRLWNRRVSRLFTLLLLAGHLDFLVTARHAAAVEPFILAVIGDQQNAVDRDRHLDNYASFTNQTDWLAANAQTNNIRFVAQVGDIVNNGSEVNEFERAAAAMATLDTAVNADGGIGIPWSVGYGNHEALVFDPSEDPAGSLADGYRQYFGGADIQNHRYTGQVGFGSVSSNELNTYHLIKSSQAPDAREYVLLNLEFDVPGHPAGSSPPAGDIPAFDAIDWAQDVMDAHPGKPTIISTHVFEGTREGPPFSPDWPGPGRNSQAEIFDKLVTNNSQVFMVLSGHTTQDTHRVRLNNAGLPVLQMVTDYSMQRFGGGGFMRLIELDEEVGELRVETFSPGIPQSPDPQYRTEWTSRFSIPIDWNSHFDDIPEIELRDPWIPEPPNTTLIKIHATGTDDATEGGYSVSSGNAPFKTLILDGTNASGNLTDAVLTFKLPDLGDKKFLSADLKFNLWNGDSIHGDAPLSDLVGIRVSASNVVTADDHQASGTTLLGEILHPWELVDSYDEGALLETGNDVAALNDWLSDNYVAGEYAVIAVRAKTPPLAPFSWFGIDAQTAELTIHTIPEPSTRCLALIGLISLGSIRTWLKTLNENPKNISRGRDLSRP